MRKLSALLVTAGLVATLTACASNPSYSACGSYESGDASSIVDVTGEVGSQPTVDFPTPLIPGTTQATQVVAGDGERLTEGQPARIELSVFDARTGELLQATNYDDTGSMYMVGGETIPSVGKALVCATVGSRLVVTSPAADAIPNAEAPSDDSYVFVIDVLDAYLAKANGAAQVPKPGEPTVVTAPNGAPGITIPNSGSESVDPPTELVVSVLQRGSGPELKKGNRAVVAYTGVLWSSNEIFDSTWKKGSVAVFELVDDALIEGFLTGLVGQTVGSQVLLVIPPELAYGDAGSGAVPPGSTLVFVVDILGQISQD